MNCLGIGRIEDKTGILILISSLFTPMSDSISKKTKFLYYSLICLLHLPTIIIHTLIL